MDVINEEFSNEIKREQVSLWYINETQTKLIIKTNTSSIKSLIVGCPLQLLFGRKNNYLCIGAKIKDIPDGALFISKAQYNFKEHEALISALQKCEFDILLINEMDILVAWAKLKISKQEAENILNFIGETYTGVYTKEVEYAHDCFCVSVENKYKTIYPKAHKIPFIEIETIIEDWNTSKVYYYGDNNYYDFKINDKEEGRTFEKEIASALTNIFPTSLYKNPKVRKGNNIRELTDIFAFYKYGSFLIEAKDVSIINCDGYSNKARRILRIQNQVKKAIKQMTGATKLFLEGNEIYSDNNEKININRNQPPHCIILITEFIHEGDWGEVEDLLFNAINETGAMFHIIDFNEFVELLKASSGKPEIIDYNLMQRWKCLMENHSIHIKGTY